MGFCSITVYDESENDCNVASESADDHCPRRSCRGAGGGGDEFTSGDHMPCTHPRECRGERVIPRRSSSTDSVNLLEVEVAQVEKRCNVVPALLMDRHHPFGGKSHSEICPTGRRVDSKAAPLQSATPSGRAAVASRARMPIAWVTFALIPCPRETADLALGWFSKYFVAQSPSSAAPIATCSPAFLIARDRGALESLDVTPRRELVVRRISHDERVAANADRQRVLQAGA